MPDNNKYFAARQEIISVARLSIYSNAFLLLVKLIIGFFMGSIAVLSEALHSGIDLLAAIIANYSVRKAGNNRGSAKIQKGDQALGEEELK